VLELSKLVPRTSIPLIVPSIKLDNHRMIGVQRDLLLYRVRELEKSRVDIHRRDEVAGPFPAFAFAILLQNYQRSPRALLILEYRTNSSCLVCSVS
jgi:hypothetical protein